MVKIKLEPPEPEDMRYTLSGLTGRQMSRLYWAMHNAKAFVTAEDDALAQALWAGPESEDNPIGGG